LEIKLNRRTFEALVSETRIEILRKLDTRPMTVSELARELGIAKSAVHEHLAKLVEAELVERVESERKWVYYRLTRKAVGILHPEMKYRLLVLLSSGVLALAGGAGMLMRRLWWAEPEIQPGEAPALMEAAPSAPAYGGGYGANLPEKVAVEKGVMPPANLTPTNVTPPPSSPPPPPHAPQELLLPVLLLLLGVVLLVLWYRQRRALQKRYIR